MSIEMLFRLLFACIMVFALGCVLGAFVMAVEHFFYERERHKKVLEAIESITQQARADKERNFVEVAYRSGETHGRKKGVYNNVDSESEDER